MLTGQPRSATVEAADECRVVELTAESLREVALANRMCHAHQRGRRRAPGDLDRQKAEAAAGRPARSKRTGRSWPASRSSSACPICSATSPGVRVVSDPEARRTMAVRRRLTSRSCCAERCSWPPAWRRRHAAGNDRLPLRSSPIRSAWRSSSRHFPTSTASSGRLPNGRACRHRVWHRDRRPSRARRRRRLPRHRRAGPGRCRHGLPHRVDDQEPHRLCIMRLRDEGKLSLDDPAERYVPELAGLVYPTATLPASPSATCSRTRKASRRTTLGRSPACGHRRGNAA